MIKLDGYIGMFWVLFVSLASALAIINLRRQRGQPLSYKELQAGRYYEIVGQCLVVEDGALVALKPCSDRKGPTRIYRFLAEFRDGVKFVRTRKTRDGKLEVEPFSVE